MKLVVVDDEKNALENLENTLAQVPEVSKVALFDNGPDALDYLAQNSADAALLDIEMRGMGGLELAKRIREAHPETGIIFVTGYSQYALEAIELHANGYLVKPAKAERIRAELLYLRAPKAPVPAQDKKLRVQCFGNFEVFIGDETIHFGRGRTKELLAYLVDRQGASCTMGEVMAVLWEDRPDTLSQRSQLRTLIADLRATLKEYGAENIIVKNRNELGVDTGLFDCDYYRFIRGDLAAVNLYQGEYMSQYSWPEMRIPSILRP